MSFFSGRETGVGASRKNAISRRRLLHGKAGRRGELSPRYRLSRQGDRRSRAPGFGRHRYHSRWRRVSSRISLSHCSLPRHALTARGIAITLRSAIFPRHYGLARLSDYRLARGLFPSYL